MCMVKVSIMLGSCKYLSQSRWLHMQDKGNFNAKGLHVQGQGDYIM